MNVAPIFAICSADPAVSSMLGTNPVRLFMFDLAPQNVQTPYAVWQVVSGAPENYLSGRPDVERHMLQIDVYADTAAEARSVMSAIEYAIELNCYVERYGGETRDSETMKYRSTMDVTWHTYR